MNLQNQIALESLRTARAKKKEAPALKISASSLTEHLLEQEDINDPDIWKIRTLRSRSFRLIDLPINAVAAPGVRMDGNKVQSLMASTTQKEVVVIDINKSRRVGRATNGFRPKVIVVAGKDQVAANLLAGRERITAWVGELAAQKLGLQKPLSSRELESRLNQKLREKYPAPRRGADVAAYEVLPWITDVYPVEQCFVYRHKGKTFKLHYTINDTEVSLDGEPIEVVQRWVSEKGIEASASRLTREMYFHCGHPEDHIDNDPNKPLKAKGKKPRTVTDRRSEVDYVLSEEDDDDKEDD